MVNKRSRMYFRMVSGSLIRRASRLIIAVLAIAIGATILSGLVTIYHFTQEDSRFCKREMNCAVYYNIRGAER